jgi:hypothetical protein
MSAIIDESPRLIAHRRYLASLNADIERPVLIPMEVEYEVPDGGIPAPNGDVAFAKYNVPSNKDLFITGLIGACEIVPSAGPGTLLDPGIALADEVRVQIRNNNDKEELVIEGSPTGQRPPGLGFITLSHLVATPFRPKAAIKLPGVWRVPADDTIEAEFRIAPTAPLEPGDVRRFGVSLVAILIRQAELLTYGRI